jgi:apolipoprotein N-acyltransferase
MKYLLIGISFLLVAFGQPAWVKAFGVLAAGCGYALFWRAMLLFPTPRERFFLSMGWFTCVQGVQLSWLVTFDYMGPLILVLYLFLILGMGAQFGLLSFLVMSPFSWSRALAIAGCWTIMEWLRLFFSCGFTWSHAGLALAASSHSLQFAAVWGIFGLSFWVILVNVSALHALQSRSIKSASVWALLALCPYVYGFVQKIWVERNVSPAGTMRVALIQTGLFPEQKDFFPVAPEAYIPPLDQWERIFNVLDKDQKVDLILLPEAALPLGAHRAVYDYLDVKNYFQEGDLPPLESPYALYAKGWKVSNVFMMQALANHFQAHVITGLDDVDIYQKYNAAFHFHPNNLPYERYEKRVLLPIAEYLPLRPTHALARFVARQFGIVSSFHPGKEAKIFQATFPVGISICLEETFSNLTRELRKKGAKVLVNVTNDVWFPRSKLPEQHFEHGRLRAAENGICLLRACNTGVTGGIDCFGNPLQILPISGKDASILYLTLPVRFFPTLYTWWGDEAILGISAIAILFHFLKARKSCCKCTTPLTF